MAEANQQGEQSLEATRMGKALWPEIWTANTAAFDAGKKITPPKLIHVVAPKYPSTMERLKQEKSVLIVFLITREGTVESPHPVRGKYAFMDEDFIREAIAAVTQWKFTPCLIEGKPVDSVGTFPVIFKLDR